ncbi:hypothetical protein JHK85_058290 [Glycine max]|nr:hypothetical protein JHK85_058290 [Glycine max]
MEIANASVSPAIHIARALGVLSIEASLATSLACSLRWSTSCLTSAEELAVPRFALPPPAAVTQGCLGVSVLDSPTISRTQDIALLSGLDPTASFFSRQVRIQTFFPNQSLFISFVVLLAQWSNLEEGSWMFFSIYHHYGPYGQIDVVRIIVCPFEKDECPTHVISAKGFVSEVNSLLVFTFGHQESRTDSLALLCKGLTSDVWKYVVEVNSSEMQPEAISLLTRSAFQNLRIVTAPFIAIRETALFPQDGPSCFCLMETRVQVQTFRNQDMAGQDSNLQSSGYEPDELTNTLPRFFPFSFFFHDSHLVPFGCLAGIEPALSNEVFRLVRDRFTPRGAYTSRPIEVLFKNLVRELVEKGFPAGSRSALEGEVFLLIVRNSPIAQQLHWEKGLPRDSKDVFVDALSLPTPMRKRAAYRYGNADPNRGTRNRITTSSYQNFATSLAMPHRPCFDPLVSAVFGSGE